MDRRSFILALAGAPAAAALLAACGKENKNDAGADTSYVLATGANDVVLRIASEGGFVAPDTIFARIPTLLVAGDGHVFAPGAITLEYPGPLVMPMTVRTITPAGLQALAKAADEARLIGFVADYTMPEGIGIADAPDTAVYVTVNGSTFEHRANALGFDQTSTPTRDRLAKFVEATGNLAALVGAANLGEEKLLDAAAYRFRATAVDPAQYTDPMTTIVWPASAGVALADATESAVVDAAKVGTLFTDAKQNTLFTEDGVSYVVAVVISLPGDDAPAA